MDRALNVLKQYYGYSSFREGQEEIIRQILSGEDVLTIMLQVEVNQFVIKYLQYY